MSSTESSSQYHPCSVCGGNEWVFIREGPDVSRPGYGKSFKLTRCAHCGQVMQNPIPDNQQLEAAYSVSDDYVCYRLSWKEPGWPVWKILRRWTTSRRLSRLKRYCNGHEMLEVGCGAGDFMLAAHKAGWRVRAVEYNRRIAEAVRNEFGFDVQVGELAPDLWEAGKFDVVAVWNVLEHVQNPLKELMIAAGYLRTGGKILLNLPSRQAAEHGLWFGRYWELLELPRHINFFDKTTLSQLCRRAGLELVVYKTPFLQSAWCYYMSSRNWANRDGKKIARWLRFLALSAGVTLALPYILKEALSDRGMDAFAVAVKS